MTLNDEDILTATLFTIVAATLEERGIVSCAEFAAALSATASRVPTQLALRLEEVAAMVADPPRPEFTLLPGGKAD